MATAGETSFTCCSTCSDDGRKIRARHYCVECEMYFCTKCLKPHNRIPLAKSHQVNDVNSHEPVDDENGDESMTPGSDSVREAKCSIHHGQLINTYCADHDDVCCEACAIVKHRSCKTVPIAIAMTGFDAVAEQNKCKDALADRLIQFIAEKEKRVENLELIGEQKAEQIEKIDSTEEIVITKIKKLANTSRQAIRSKYKRHKKTLQSDIETLDVVITTIQTHFEKLEHAHEQLFVLVKSSNAVLKDWETLLEAMIADWKEKDIGFSVDAILEERVMSLTAFGRLDDITECLSKAYTASLKQNLPLSYVNPLPVYDMCLMDDGQLLSTYGSQLKRFDSNINFMDTINMPGKAVAVCKIAPHKVAVRIEGSQFVQFLSVGETMEKLPSFTRVGVGYGMTYDAGTEEIYACEGDTVSVYNKTGTETRTYDEDGNGQSLFTDCRQIALSEDKQDIYVSDRHHGLVVLDKNGTLKMRVCVPGIGNTWPLCLFSDTDNVCLVGGTSGIISQVKLDRDENKVGNLIDTPDGRGKTYCAVYDREQSRLYVGGTGNVSVYTISSK